jgi:hypothetical protein
MFDYFGQKTNDSLINLKLVKSLNLNNLVNTQFAQKIFRCGFSQALMQMICFKWFDRSVET